MASHERTIRLSREVVKSVAQVVEALLVFLAEFCRVMAFHPLVVADVGLDDAAEAECVSLAWKLTGGAIAFQSTSVRRPGGTLTDAPPVVTCLFARNHHTTPCAVFIA